MSAQPPRRPQAFLPDASLNPPVLCLAPGRGLTGRNTSQSGTDSPSLSDTSRSSGPLPGRHRPCCILAIFPQHKAVMRLFRRLLLGLLALLLAIPGLYGLAALALAHIHEIGRAHV